MADQGGFGAKLKITITATLTLVVGLRDVKFPEQIKELAEATSHDSTGGYRRFIDTGLRELGEFSATLRWDKLLPTHAAVLTAFNGTAAVNMSIEDPLGQEIIAFAAFVSKIARMSPMDDVYEAEVEFRPSGPPTITP
jgi:hypothetical protein